MEDQTDLCECPDACERSFFGYDISYTSFSQLSMGTLLDDASRVDTSYQKVVNIAHRYVRPLLSTSKRITFFCIMK